MEKPTAQEAMRIADEQKRGTEEERKNLRNGIVTEKTNGKDERTRRAEKTARKTEQKRRTEKKKENELSQRRRTKLSLY